jgi:nucleoid-associated protein YgaU
MRTQWTATALVMALGLAAPVLAQDDPMTPQTDPTQQTPTDQTVPAPDERETPAPADPAPADPAPSAKQGAELSGEEYVVQSGDTLSGLADRFLGSADQWKQIADANAISNPDMISVGQRLQIPQNGSGGAAPATGSQDDQAAPEQQ